MSNIKWITNQFNHQILLSGDFEVGYYYNESGVFEDEYEDEEFNYFVWVCNVGHNQPAYGNYADNEEQAKNNILNVWNTWLDTANLTYKR